MERINALVDRLSQPPDPLPKMLQLMEQAEQLHAQLRADCLRKAGEDTHATFPLLLGELRATVSLVPPA
eukprot:14639358-Ditylum_brightwellii.AAC.1